MIRNGYWRKYGSRIIPGLLVVFFLCSRSWAFVPDDPKFEAQWYLEKINMPTAWNTADGQGILIAVIDSGIDASLPEFKDKIWTNPGEIPGNGVDDDHNGYVDDVHGWDWPDWDNEPDDENGHGTFVTGIILARTNDGQGIAGIAGGRGPDRLGAIVMPLKVTHKIGDVGKVADLAAAIRYAADMGAKIINISVGTAFPDDNVKEAVDYADSKGVLMIAGAGNGDMAGHGDGIDYPAAYDHVIAVGSVDSEDIICNFSDFGPQLDMVAPGRNIYSTELGGDYSYRWGTSYSAPMVTGVAALIMQANPRLTRAQVEERLLKSAVDLNSPGWDEYSGWGRLDAAGAMGCESLDSSAPVVVSADPPDGAIVNKLDEISLVVSDDICGVDFKASTIQLMSKGKILAGVQEDDGDKTITYRLSSPAANNGTSDGKFAIAAQLVDLKQNKSRVFRSNFVLDTIPPKLSVDKFKSPTNMDSIIISGAVSDAHDVNVSIQDKIVKLSRERFNQRVYLKPGENTVLILAQDLAGNIVSREIKVIRDVSGPNLSDPIPENGGFANALRPMISAKIVDAGSRVDPKSIRFYFNGKSFAGTYDQKSSMASFRAPINLKEGKSYSVKLTASDMLGNKSGPLEWSFTVDITPPRLEIFTWPSSTKLNRIVVSGKVEDVNPYEVTINGEDPEWKDGRFEKPVALNEGENIIEITARDAAGNKTTKKIKITKDSKPPNLIITNPKSNVFVRVPAFIVSGETDGIKVKVNGVEGMIRDDGSFEVVVNLKEGGNEIEISAEDAAGNISSRHRRMTLDSTPPKLEITSPGDGAKTADKLILVQGTVSDAVSLTINGIKVKPDGGFSQPIELNTGPNRIEAVAVDGLGNKTEKSVTVFFEPEDLKE